MVIDTDSIIRFITKDDSGKASRVREILKREPRLVLTDVTLAEIYWTLSSFYKFERKRILEPLKSLIRRKNVSCSEELLREVILILEEANISFIDAYEAAYAKLYDDGEVLSFDKGFDKIKGVKRVEP